MEKIKKDKNIFMNNQNCKAELFEILKNVKIKEFKEKVIKEENFKNLSLEEQKRMFLTMLDLNQMYVQKSEMADKKFNISKEDQEMTNLFYNGE